MTPSRFNSRWMYAQSGRTRSCAGAARRNNRASSTASSSSAASGQPNPRCAVLCRYSETVPTPMAQAWAIARWDNPRSCLRRRTSRIFLTSSLRAGIASPSFRKAKRAVIRLPTSVHDDRNGCSTSPDSVFNIPDLLFNFPGFSVHLPPDWAFKILRITQMCLSVIGFCSFHSRTTGLRGRCGFGRWLPRASLRGWPRATRGPPARGR